MLNGILVTVNLKGVIGGNEKHKDYQTITVDATPVGLKQKPVIINTTIKHTDRKQTECCIKTHIHGEVIASWIGKCPSWEREFIWKSMSKTQRLRSHLNRMDEGFGVTYQEL